MRLLAVVKDFDYIAWIKIFVYHRKLPIFSALNHCLPKKFTNFVGKWQQKFLPSHLEETTKQYMEVYYRIFMSALFRDVF